MEREGDSIMTDPNTHPHPAATWQLAFEREVKARSALFATHADLVRKHAAATERVAQVEEALRPFAEAWRHSMSRGLSASSAIELWSDPGASQKGLVPFAAFAEAARVMGAMGSVPTVYAPAWPVQHGANP